MARFLHRGRPHVMIRKGLKSYNFSIIDLMARAFIGETPPGYEVEVRNGIKTDMRLENLYYAPYRLPGTKASMTKKRVMTADLYEAALLIQAGSRFISVREACSALRVSRSFIENAVKSGALKVHRRNPNSQRFKIPIDEIFQWLRRKADAVGAELPCE
jgi:excisionase family DNA binding protein